MTADTKQLSIIIPVYNVKEYLAPCLDSLLNQSFQDFEILTVDDVSTDGSKEIARSYAQRYPDKVRALEHSVNTRQGGARNTGINAATGKYILFLDSDDYLKPDAFDVLIDVMEREQADIVEFCQEWVDEDGQFLRRQYWPERALTPEGAKQSITISGMGPCNKLCRRELFADGQIRFPEKFFYEDYWTVPKLLLRAKKVIYLNQSLYCYRQRTSSTTHDTNPERNRDVLLGTDELLRYFRENDVSPERLAELEYLAVEHVLINATLRVNSIDRKHALQREIKQYMDDRFPHWRKNSYLSYLPTKKQRLLKLIDQEKYGMLYLRYHCRNNVTGSIKHILHALKSK